MGSIIRSIGTIFYSLIFLNSRIGFNGLKYLYSGISVIDKRILKSGHSSVRGRPQCDYSILGRRHSFANAFPSDTHLSVKCSHKCSPLKLPFANEMQSLKTLIRKCIPIRHSIHTSVISPIVPFSYSFVLS